MQESCGPGDEKCFDFKGGRKGRLRKALKNISYGLKSFTKKNKKRSSTSTIPDEGGKTTKEPKQSHQNPRLLTMGGFFK